MTFEEENKCREEGYDAFWNDKSTCDNPYKQNTDENIWWEIGFMEGFNSQYEELYMP
jgi:hypothetical protein